MTAQRSSGPTRTAYWLVWSGHQTTEPSSAVLPSSPPTQPAGSCGGTDAAADKALRHAAVYPTHAAYGLAW